MLIWNTSSAAFNSSCRSSRVAFSPVIVYFNNSQWLKIDNNFSQIFSRTIQLESNFSARLLWGKVDIKAVEAREAGGGALMVMRAWARHHCAVLHRYFLLPCLIINTALAWAGHSDKRREDNQIIRHIDTSMGTEWSGTIMTDSLEVPMFTVFRMTSKEKRITLWNVWENVINKLTD